MDGVGSIDTSHDGEAGNGILVRLTKEIDLDELLLDLAIEGELLSYRQRHDDPTILPGSAFLDRGREAQVGWFRKQPCTDGRHNWDMAFVSSEKPEGNKARGAFLGVFLG